MDIKEKTVSTERIFDGRIIRLRRDTVQLPNGRQVMREVIEHPGGVGVAAVDDDGNIYMVKQYRTGAGCELTEIPAGKLEYGEDHFECGKRELREETGLCAGEYTYLGYIIPTPAYCEERIHLYLARKLTQAEQSLDEDEFLNVMKLPFDEACRMAEDGRITDAKTVAALLKARAIIGER